MKIIVGLGNPGKEYERTAHNAGFLVIDKIFNSKFEIFNQFLNSKFENKKNLKSEIAEREIDGEKVLLVKPMTFMNRSGEAVSAITNFYKVNLSDLIVIHDDADLSLGKIKIQSGGGSAGHHGIESIIKSLGTNDLIRIRMGIRIGEDKAGDFVLKVFKDQEQQVLEEMINKATEAVKTILEKGLAPAMNKYNGES